MKMKVYEFAWGGRKDYLPVRTRYISAYCFYEVEMFRNNLNSLQLFMRLTVQDLLNGA